MSKTATKPKPAPKQKQIRLTGRKAKALMDLCMAGMTTLENQYDEGELGLDELRAAQDAMTWVRTQLVKKGL